METEISQPVCIFVKDIEPKPRERKKKKKKKHILNLNFNHKIIIKVLVTNIWMAILILNRLARKIIRHSAINIHYNILLSNT